MMSPGAAIRRDILILSIYLLSLIGICMSFHSDPTRCGKNPTAGTAQTSGVHKGTLLFVL